MKAKVKELIPDEKNFNKGNSYGESLIEKSFQKFGAGRSILLDKNNKVIAGNQSLQKFAEQGLEDIGIEISPQYCQIIVERMLKLDPSLEIKRNGKAYSLNTEKTPNLAES